MPFARKRSSLVLTDEDRKELEGIQASRTRPHAQVVRSRILLAYADGKAINAIAREVGTSRPAVERCVDKALSGGIRMALKDLHRKGRPPKISTEDKAWVVSLACTKPKDLGYAQEIWTYTLLGKHVRQHADAEGHPALRRVSRSSLHDILCEHPVKPHKVSYYLERRDPDFDRKMAQILVVYKEVQLVNEKEKDKSEKKKRKWAVICYDEKPGIQAIENTAPDLPPVPGKHRTIGRDHEYRRHGTVSLLAGIDLHDGRVTAIIRDRHRSREFTEFLATLDEAYPPEWRLRIILDNHSSHISKETMKWLKKHPNRFEFIFTPKHASWLNLIEIFFSKMTRSFLRHIRVASKEELKHRINHYLGEINAPPVVFRWQYKLADVTV